MSMTLIAIGQLIGSTTVTLYNSPPSTIDHDDEGRSNRHSAQIVENRHELKDWEWESQKTNTKPSLCETDNRHYCKYGKISH